MRRIGLCELHILYVIVAMAVFEGIQPMLLRYVNNSVNIEKTDLIIVLMEQTILFQQVEKH